jgi:hypothetical protein
MFTIFGDRGSAPLSSTPLLFSPALISFLAGEKRAKVEPERVEISAEENDKTRKASNFPTILPSNGNSKREPAPERAPEPASSFTQKNIEPVLQNEAGYDLVWPTLFAFGGAGLAVYLSQRSRKTSNIRSVFSRVPLHVASPTLLYSSLVANVFFSATILYMYERQRTSIIQSQFNLPIAWEEQATRRAKSRTLALQEHYETHLEALDKQHKQAKDDIQSCWSAIQTSQTSALGTIAAAERAALRGVRKATEAVERLDSRVSRLEKERPALNQVLEDRMRGLEIQGELTTRRLNDDEDVLKRVQRRLGRIQDRLRT